ncbi:MAG TPA: winged helix-turn-helix transcriptional regulator [Dehalococcoidia bacterium]|nr:winged helix-turn-helix transcriptional regulator [Dehalococcoidia bacterium]
MKKVRENGWYLWSSHGTVLFYIASNSGSTIQEIADGLSLTTRTIWGIVGDLRRAGMLVIEKEGRRHRYRVNLDAPFRHPTIRDVSLRTLLSELPATAHRRERAAASS